LPRRYGSWIRPLGHTSQPPKPGSGSSSATAAGGIGRIRIRLDGVAVALETGVGPDGILEQSLRLAPGENRLEVSAFDADNRLESETLALVVRAPTVPAAPASVHVLVIGVGDYGYRYLATGRPAQGAARLAAFRGAASAKPAGAGA